MTEIDVLNAIEDREADTLARRSVKPAVPELPEIPLGDALRVCREISAKLGTAWGDSDA